MFLIHVMNQEQSRNTKILQLFEFFSFFFYKVKKNQLGSKETKKKQNYKLSNYLPITKKFIIL